MQRENLAPQGAECSNPGCIVRESRETPLLRCAKCQFTLYCSHDCQKAHWPDHKESCMLTRKNAETYSFDKQGMSVAERVREFEALFGGDLVKTTIVLLLGQGSRWMGETRAVQFRLVSLPSNYKYPRLEVGSVVIQPVTRLAKESRHMLLHAKRKSPDQRAMLMILQHDGVDSFSLKMMSDSHIENYREFYPVDPEDAKKQLNGRIREFSAKRSKAK